MPYINEAEFRKRLRGDLWGCYVFFGDEDYLKTYCIKAAREAVCPDEGLACFNDISIDFPDFTVDALADALSVPPMMSERKVVTLRSFDFTSLAKPSDTDAILELMGQYREDRENLLIISVIPDGMEAGYLPKRPSEFFKRLEAVCTPVLFEESTPAKLQAWAARHFQHDGINASPEAVRFLIDHCGRSMYALSYEIGKLCAYLHAGGRTDVTAEDIRYVTVSEEDCDAFALSNALMNGDRSGALSVLSIMKFRQVKVEYVMFEIAELYSRLYQTKLLMADGQGKEAITKIFNSPTQKKRIHEYTVELYMKAALRASEQTLLRQLTLCRETDVAMKSFGKRNYEQVEKLICLL